MSEQNTDLAAVTENLRELPAELTDAAFEVLLQKAALIVGLAQIYAPVKTGRLRDSINFKVVEDTEKNKSIMISVDCPYGEIVEARTPFLAPAVAAVQGDIEAALNSLQEKVIDV